MRTWKNQIQNPNKVYNWFDFRYICRSTPQQAYEHFLCNVIYDACCKAEEEDDDNLTVSIVVNTIAASWADKVANQKIVYDSSVMDICADQLEETNSVQHLASVFTNWDHNYKDHLEIKTTATSIGDTYTITQTY